jgi:hypothetical protein
MTRQRGMREDVYLPSFVLWPPSSLLPSFRNSGASLAQNIVKNDDRKTGDATKDRVIC